MVLLSGDGSCEEDSCKEEFGEDAESQDGAQEEREEEYEARGSDEPLLAGVYAGSGERPWGEGEL